MAASLFLLLAVVSAFVGGSGPWTMPWMIVTVVLAAAAGTGLPDVDTPLGLGHRSAVTHSILPLLACLLDHRTWPMAAGLGFGIGFHLAADLFPMSMRGYATIKLPLWGSIGAFASYVWIATNAAANLIGGVVVLERIAAGQVAAGALAASGALGAAYLIRAQGGCYALALLAVLGWLMFR